MMLLREPDYYETFHCIANACKHNCCATNWEIDVDEKTYVQYCQLQTEFGERLRKSIKKDEHLHFKLKHGKCPFLDKAHLCEVYQNLGEASMCRVCTIYPRVEAQYGTLQEKALGLSCEEVGRILFTHPEPVRFIEREVPERMAIKEEKVEKYDRCQIEAMRDEAIALLQDRSRSLQERFSLFLLFSGAVQKCIDENQMTHLEMVVESFKREDAKVGDWQPQVSEEAVHNLFRRRMEIMMEMEVVEEEWGEAMNNVVRIFYGEAHKEKYAEMAIKLAEIYPQTLYQYEHMMVYFADQYLIQALYDGAFLNRAKYCVMGYLTIRDMDLMTCFIQGEHFSLEDRIENVRLFCKQVQHSGQSEKYLKEKVATESVFSMAALLKQLDSNQMDDANALLNSEKEA